MLEIKITALEITEAMNNLARAIAGAVTSSCKTEIGTAPAAAAEKKKEEPPKELKPTVPVAQTAPPENSTPPVQAVPTAAPQYTLEMISKAGTALIDCGKMTELMGLLGKYGVEALTSLDPKLYGAFANDLRAIGASI